MTDSYSSSSKKTQERPDQSRLEEIKENIKAAFTYNEENVERFHQFQKFAFMSALEETDLETLNAYGKPILETNILNAPIDRLCGEWSKQQPSIYISATDGAQVDEQLLEVLDGHIRHDMYKLNSDNTQYAIYRDQISGGYSSYKVYTDYENSMSFNQVICTERVYEPTLVAYDPMARKVTKCDAKNVTERFPMTKKDFEYKYPDVDIKAVVFNSSDNFLWAFENGEQKIIVIADYYEEKQKNEEIVRLASGEVFTRDEYDEKLAEWNKLGKIEQPPEIVETRETCIYTYCRYRLIECEILEYEETSFSYLPIVFVDGNSVNIKDTKGGSIKQFTKPYIYHAYGLQRMVNLSAQLIANDFESMVMHKFKVAKESLPQEEEYLEAYKDVQKASTLVYNAFYDNDPNQPVPPPQEIQRVPLPQEVVETFNNCMSMLTNILGSYDATLGVQKNQLSGVAIVEGATQSNASAMPYVVNNIHALNQLAQIWLSMYPKYYVTPRTIPIVTKDGKRSSVKINDPNDPNSVQFNYNPNDLHVKIEAGVNFSIAKNQALQQITQIMQVSPLFAQFINEQGIDVLFDNMEFRGVDIIKDRAEKFMQQQAQNPQPDPNMLIAQSKQSDSQARMLDAQTNQAKVTADIQKGSYETMISAKSVEVENKNADTKRIQALQAIGESNKQLLLEASKVQAEENRTHVETGIAIHDALLKHQDQEHNHLKDIIGMAQDADMNEANKENMANMD